MPTPSTQIKDVGLLYERLRALPWPTVAGSVGEFALYESFLAGCANRVARRALLDASRVPMPDEGTLAHVTRLRQKSEPTPEEVAFLNYFNLLEEIRLALGGMAAEDRSATSGSA